MPPYRDPNRLFYNPVDPVMLTQEQMQQLSPLELQAATDQLDQHLVLVLQQIEENFAKCNQVVTESLLPAVEQHGENSMRIYESIKFWRPFFEAAASMRLNEPYGDDAATETEEVGQNSELASPDRTVSSDQTYSRQSIGSDADDVDGTPRASRRHDLSNASSSLPPEPQWSTEEQFASPFLSSNQPLPANSAMKQPSSHTVPDQQLQRLRLRDLPPDSPDVPEPEFETAVFGGGIGKKSAAAGSGGRTAKGKSRDVDLSVDSNGSPSFSLLQSSEPSRSDPPSSHRLAAPSPRAPRPGGGDRAHTKLLDKILRQNLASPARGPGSSTPGRPMPPDGARGKYQQHQPQAMFPPDIPREWDGIANLSQTALDAFPSPIKRRPSIASTSGGVDEDDAGREDSFVRMMARAVPSSVAPPFVDRPHAPSSSATDHLTSSPAPARPNPASRNGMTMSTSQRGGEPPRSLNSPSKLTRTPAKYAAKLTARNVYDALGLEFGGGSDSPLPSPPSILRTNHKPFNLYEHTQQQNLRQSMAPSDHPQPGGGRAIEGDDEDAFEGDLAPSPTTEKRSRIMSNSAHYDDDEDGSILSSHHPPSFIRDRGQDVSHTQPFNLYEHQLEQQQEKARRSNSHGQGHGDGDEPEVDEDAIDDLLYGGKTMTFKQEQRMSMAPLDFGGIVDDDREEPETQSGTDGAGTRDRYDEESFVEEDEDRQAEPSYVAGGGGAYEDESFNIERGLKGAGIGGGGFGNRLLDGPEDTLFGMPQQSQPSQAQARQSSSVSQASAYGYGGEQGEDTFTETQEPLRTAAARDGGRGQGGFRLHGMGEMETLHGGDLLSSEPFQASPLAGRWGLGGGGPSQ
ncbi:hypothetical protein JCM3766R1_006046 [Sporobolomyces carnicolor]